MAMALKADVTRACSESGTQKPVDLVHLSRLTMGDRNLELDLLKMFSAQINQYQESLKACNDAVQTKRAVHTIKGAARSIGAMRLSEIAESAEETGIADHAMFEIEMLAIKNYIAELVSSH